MISRVRVIPSCSSHSLESEIPLSHSLNISIVSLLNLVNWQVLMKRKVPIYSKTKSWGSMVIKTTFTWLMNWSLSLGSCIVNPLNFQHLTNHPPSLD